MEGMKPFKNIERGFSLTHKAVTSILAGAFIFLMSSFDKEALAKVQCETDKSSEGIEFVYQKSENDKAERVRITTLHDIGSIPSTNKLSTPLFDSIIKTDIPENSVNYTIDDQPTFRSFLIREIEHVKKEAGLEGKDLSELTPKDLIVLSALVVHRNFYYDDRLVKSTAEKENPQYNFVLSAEMDDTPMDSLLIGKVPQIHRDGERTGVVCRHFAAGLKIVAENIKQLSGSKFLKNVYVGELTNNSANHAWNTVFELVKADNRDPLIKIAFIDTSIHSVQGKSVFFVDFLKNIDSNNGLDISTVFENYLSPSFSISEKREFLECLFEQIKTVDGGPNAFFLDRILSLYRKEISDLRAGGNQDSADALERKYKIYIDQTKKTLSILESQAQSRKLVWIRRDIQMCYKEVGDYESSLRLLKKLYNETSFAPFEQIGIGDDYADALGRQGDERGAEEVYEELLRSYKDFRRNDKRRYIAGMKTWWFGFNEKFGPILNQTLFNPLEKFEPFANEENFKKYLEYKKGEWAELRKTQ